MTETAAKLRSELEALPPAERAELAHFLIQSLSETKEGEPEQEQEFAERAEAIRSGREPGEPAEEVFASLRAKYSSQSSR